MTEKRDRLLNQLSFLLSFHYSNRERKAILEDYQELFAIGADNVMKQNASELLRAEQREYRSEAGWLHVISRNIFLWLTVYFAILPTVLHGLNWFGFYVAIPVCSLLYLMALLLSQLSIRSYFDQSREFPPNKGWFVPAVISLVYALVFYTCVMLQIPGITFGTCAEILAYASFLGAILCFFCGTYMQRERYLYAGINCLYFVFMTKLIIFNLHLMDNTGNTYTRIALLLFAAGVLCALLNLLIDFILRRHKPEGV